MPPPQRSALTLADFFILPSWLHNIVQTTTHDDVFPLCRAESPSLTFNLVGRRLHLAKRVGDTLPESGRVSVYCCLPRRPFAHEQTTSHFSARKISKRAAPSAPPPSAIPSPPPLSRRPSQQHTPRKVAGRGGTGGFKVIHTIRL